MIIFVDEDFRGAKDPWAAELRSRGHEVASFWNASQAYEHLIGVTADRCDLVLIDVMLAAGNPDDLQFSFERTKRYYETGLRLIEDLAKVNDLFPTRAVMLTNVATGTTWSAIQQTRAALDLEVWRKAEVINPMDLGDRVENVIRERKAR